MRKLFLCASAVSALLATSTLHAEEALPRRNVLSAEEGFLPPPGYVETARPLRGLWISGTIVGGASWAASVLGAGLYHSFSDLFNERKEDNYLLGMIPFAGPFIVAGEEPDDAPVFASLGSLQIVGVGLLMAGLATEQTVWVLDEKADVKTTVQLAPTGLRIDF